MLASLYNAPRTADDLNEFSFANADLHARQVQQALAQRNVVLTSYTLDPIPTTAGRDEWLQRHQQMHNDINSLLGITGSDLSELDWTKPSEVASWAYLHAQEHQLAATALALT